MAHRVAVIGGDGIGPEVVAEALKVVAAAGVELDTTDFDLGGARYLRDGTVLPDEVPDELRGFDALLLGAVGTPDVPPGLIERGLLLKMRFDLDLYINQRPFLAPDGPSMALRTPPRRGGMISFSRRQARRSFSSQPRKLNSRVMQMRTSRSRRLSQLTEIASRVSLGLARTNASSTSSGVTVRGVLKSM